MSTDLSEEQRLMRQSCRDFVDDVIIPFIRGNWQREWSMTPEDRLPPAILEGAEKVGIRTLGVPEEFGGIELDRASEVRTFALIAEEIAQFGMNGLTGNHKVRVIAGLGALGTGDADATKKASTRLLATIGSFRNHLDSDERIEVCDDNPLGVAVSIRATFGGALAEIEAKLLQAV